MLVDSINKDSFVMVLELNDNTNSINIKYVGQVIAVVENSYKSFMINCVDGLDNTNHKFADVMMQKGSELFAIPYKKIDGIKLIILPINADILNNPELIKYSFDSNKLNQLLDLFINLGDNKNAIRLNIKFPKQPIVTTRTKKSLKYRLQNLFNWKLSVSLHQ